MEAQTVNVSLVSASPQLPATHASHHISHQQVLSLHEAQGQTHYPDLSGSPVMVSHIRISVPFSDAVARRLRAHKSANSLASDKRPAYE